MTDWLFIWSALVLGCAVLARFSRQDQARRWQNGVTLPHRRHCCCIAATSGRVKGPCAGVKMPFYLRLLRPYDSKTFVSVRSWWLMGACLRDPAGKTAHSIADSLLQAQYFAAYHAALPQIFIRLL
ncbi:hypothetical protein [Paracoccus pantotrophus]|uniref:hypothetical protein n=1 Tax=Paracoccus pantotrophus TaxID=82367 RepID=UPI001160A9D5|nr:hypothetical protein [Paracoccus pantotrophus]MDF3853996.1 hypothetical protein [Paracoccus pantotrophus]